MKINSLPAWISHLVLLVWIIVVYGCGLWNYGTGFLLSRIVINEINHCENTFRPDDSSLPRDQSHALPANLSSSNSSINRYNEYCFPARFKRAVWIIIDGLRYDFAFYDGSEKLDPHFHLQMPVFKETLKKHWQSAFLAPFVADPPTTTLQRLKGLTTGSLPTFIDLSANFAGSEILEDSLISQAASAKQKIVFMGDDTWKDLFPGKFHKSYFYPSFNVKDLHTVDLGIKKHLIPELLNGDFDILVAHFLGVDHCGHRYGPSHPEMALKLREMDLVLRDVMTNMSSDTVLFVMGDHGMTRSGDHGGDSQLELNSVLFVYSPAKIRASATTPEHQVEPVSQVDFVPTLSLLLGLPIPFSNLGCLIPDLFQAWPKLPSKQANSSVKSHGLYTLMEGLHLNALQVHQYLRAYATLSKDFASSELSNLESKLHQAHTLRQECSRHHANLSTLNKTCEHYLNYLQDVKHMCSKKWAQFDVFTMWMGIGILISITVVTGILSWALAEAHADPGIMGLIILLGTAAWSLVTLVLYMSEICTNWRHLLTLLCLITLKPMLVQNFKYIRKCQLFSGACVFKDTNVCSAILVCSLFFFSSFSNSFVVNEDAVTLFLVSSLLILGMKQRVIAFVSSERASKDKVVYISARTICAFVLLTFVMLFSVRLGSWFYKCREEQAPCDTSSFLQPLSNFPGEWQNYKTSRFLLSMSCAISWMVGFLWALNHYRYLYGDDLTVLFVRYALPLSTVCLCSHWVLGLAPASTIERLLPQKQEVPAQSACILSLLVALVTWVFPPGIQLGSPLERFHLCLLTSGATLQLSLVLLLQLLAGDGLAPAWILICFAPAVWWAAQVLIAQNEKSLQSFPTFQFIVAWWAFCSHGFYATGHQATFTSLHWNAAFMTSSGNHTSNILPAAAVLLNTFSSQGLFALPLPVLISGVELVRKRIAGPDLAARIMADLPKVQRSLPLLGSGTFSRYEIMLLRFQLGFFLCSGLKLLGSVLASCFLRRHLMVWKVFAPKLIFEALSLAVSSAFILLGHLVFFRIVLRMHNHAHKQR